MKGNDVYNIRDPNPAQHMAPIIRFRYLGPTELIRPKTAAKIRRHIASLLLDNPTGGEGVKWIGGVEFWFSFMVLDDGVVDVNFIERKIAEEKLNEHGLSTVEPWSPWEQTH
jgi:hypothetical protein